MRGGRLAGGWAGVAAACLAAAAVAGAQAPTLPSNDLQQLLSVTGAQTPMPPPTQQNPEPPLAPVPRADCDAASHPLAGEQGRVPADALNSPDAARGWTCNTKVVGTFGSLPGGFRVWR